MWAQMGDRATEGALGSRGTTSGGHGALLVPGALPQPPPHSASPQAGSPELAPGPSPPWPWQPPSLLFKAGQPLSHSLAIQGGGRTAMVKMHFNRVCGSGGGEEGTQGWRGPCPFAVPRVPESLLLSTWHLSQAQVAQV